MYFNIYIYTHIYIYTYTYIYIYFFFSLHASYIIYDIGHLINHISYHARGGRGGAAGAQGGRASARSGAVRSEAVTAVGPSMQ